MSQTALDRTEFDRRLDELALILDEQAVMQRSLEVVASQLGLDVTWMAEGEGDALRINHVTGARTRGLFGLQIPRGWGLTGKTFESARPDAVDDYLASTGITHHFDEQISAEGVVRLISAPIVLDGRVIGVVSGGSRAKGSFGAIAVERLARASERTATALATASRVRQIAEAAVYDDRRAHAATLHDSVGAMLFAIQAGVRELSNNLREDRELHTQATTIEAQAVAAAQALRESLTAMAAVPRSAALEVDLLADCRAFEQRTGIATSLVILSPDALILDGARSDAMLGVVREALVNVEKHAQAGSVVVTVARDGTAAHVTITDDGAGLSHTQHGAPQTHGTGLGLAEQQRRFARLGGQVTVQSPDEGGVVVRACIPLGDR